MKRGDNGCTLKVEPAGSEAERRAKDDLSQGVDSRVYKGGHDGRGHVNQDKDYLKPPSPSDEPSGDKEVQIKSAFL